MRRSIFMGIYLLVTAWVIGMDQLSKRVVSHHLSLGQAIHVNGFFSIWLLHNRGAAFSLLANAGGAQRWLFIAIALLVSVFIVIWMWRLAPRQHGQALALSFVLGGALGNVIDRIRLSYVVDFIYFHYQQWYWPAFNVADSAICIGVLCLMIHVLRERRHQVPQQK